MPVEYEIDHDQRLVRARAYGVVTMQDLVAFQREIWSRNDVIGYDELIDTSQALWALDFTGANLQDAALLASSMDIVKSSTKLAIVAPNKFYYGLGRLYETYRSRQKGIAKQVAVFRSVEEALAWIHRIQLKDDESNDT